MVADPAAPSPGQMAPPTVVREGYVWRGSDVVDNVVNKRYAKLFRDVFVTFRKETDPEPTKAWPLYRACDLTRVEKKELMFSKKGYNNVVAWLGGKFERVDGFAFTVSWLKPTMMKDTRLMLGFINESDANTWHGTLTRVIAQLGPEPVIPTDVAFTSSTGAPSDEQDATKILNRNVTAREDSVKGLHALPGVGEEEDEVSGVELASSSLAETSDAAGASLQGGSWSALKFTNGTAVFYEEDETGGAYMVSCVVRAPPKSCLEALLSGSFFISSTDKEILKKDGDLEVVRFRVHPTGLRSWFLASRQLTIERSWREEEDGTFVVLFKSTHEFSGPQKDTDDRGLSNWWSKPVDAHIPAGGFTISPLRDEYLNSPGPSPESLVTLVLKIDLGGACSASSHLNPILCMLGFIQGWIEQLLMTVVVLRDSVEQSKFTVYMTSAVKSLAQRTGSRMLRTTSSLLDWGRRALSFHPEQHKAVQEALLQRSASQMDAETSEGFRPLDGVLDSKYWSNPGPSTFRVRGQNYLQDRKKIPAGDPKFYLDWVYLVRLKQPTKDVARFLPAARSTGNQFTFIVQIMVPGPPHLGLIIGWTQKQESFKEPESNGAKTDASTPKDAIADAESMDPFDVSLVRFVRGNDETRDSMFKLIPYVVEGSWIIQQSVGHTPVIMGRKLKQYYSQGPGYFEVDIDVASSRAAYAVVQLVSGATRSLKVDMAILLEGKRTEELPEQLIGTVRLDHVDLDMAVPLETIIENEEMLHDAKTDPCDQ